MPSEDNEELLNLVPGPVFLSPLLVVNGHNGKSTVSELFERILDK